ncbi:hypothetical protein CR513_56806, partial [Mucuna pruriens]
MDEADEQAIGSENNPSQTIPNPKGGVGAITLQSGKEFRQQSTPQQMLRPISSESELGADSQVQQQARSVPLPFPAQTIPTRRSKTDEDLLKLFKRVEINIPFLDTIKQIPKYAKFLKELCMHKRKKLKGGFDVYPHQFYLSRKSKHLYELIDSLPLHSTRNKQVDIQKYL